MDNQARLGPVRVADQSVPPPCGLESGKQRRSWADHRAMVRAMNRARKRAQDLLIREYPDQFDEIYARCAAEEGVEPTGRRGRSAVPLSPEEERALLESQIEWLQGRLALHVVEEANEHEAAEVRVLVRQQRRRVRMSPEHQERADAMAEAWVAGKTFREIGAEYGLTKQRVQQILAETEVGQQARVQRKQQAEAAEAEAEARRTEAKVQKEQAQRARAEAMAKRYAEGRTLVQIGVEFGISYTYVQRLLARYGLRQPGPPRRRRVASSEELV